MDQKEVEDKLDCISKKNRNILHILGDWAEYLWLQTYHKYYNTSKYQEWKRAEEFIKAFAECNKKYAYLLK